MSTISSLLKTERPDDGEYRGLWGPPMRAILDRLEEAIAGTTIINSTGGTEILDDDASIANESRSSLIYVTGALASELTIIVPNRSKEYAVINATSSGAFGVYVQAADGDPVAVFRGHGAVLRATAAKNVYFIGPQVAMGTGRIHASMIPDGSIEAAKLASGVQANITAGVQGAAKTGDVKFKMTSVVDAGWLWMDGKTIGNAASGATSRANADTWELFLHLYKDQDNTLLPIQASNGSASVRTTTGTPDENALTDFNLNKRLPLPFANGCNFAALDNMGGTSRNLVTAAQADVLGGRVGAETVPILRANLPAVNMTGSATDVADHRHHGLVGLTASESGGNPVTSSTQGTRAAVSGANSQNYEVKATNSEANVARTSLAGGHGHVTNTALGGSDTPLNKMPPTMFGYVLIKL
jgi:hypothetical protein